MKKILILNGSPKKNGNTAKLIKAFTEGAQAAGHEVREFHLQSMNINGCLDCQGCRNRVDMTNPCVQNDDMAEIYEAFASCDVIVFASPAYFWSITGQLKTAIDRLYAYVFWKRAEHRETVLLMTSGAPEVPDVIDWYGGFERYVGWKNLGVISGFEKTDESRLLGSRI